MKKFKVGDSIEIVKKVTDENVLHFSLLSGDNNPIHLDDTKVNPRYHEKKIAHGIYIASLFSAIIGTQLPGNGTIYISQSYDFKKPIYMNTEVCLLVKIKKIILGFAILDTKCYGKDGELYIDGEAKVILPEPLGKEEGA